MRPISRPADAGQLDGTVAAGQRVARWIRPGRIRDALHGGWLGHPLHPLLVQLPAGMWLPASALDLVAPRSDTAARPLAAAALAASAPAIAARAVDRPEQHEQQMQAGVVHALANSLAVGLHGASLTARTRRADQNLRLAALAAADLGGVLGGHISFRLAGGTNHAGHVPHVVEPGWHHPATCEDLPEGKPVRRLVGEVPAAAVRTGDHSCAPGTAASGSPTDPSPAAPQQRHNRRSRPAWPAEQSRSAYPGAD